jgi:rhamnosyltransferase
MKICAVVVVYNGAHRIGITLPITATNFEFIVVVDNHSTDRSLEIIRSLNLKNVEILSNNQNFGISYALNQGIRLAKIKGFEWVVTLDQDSLLTKDNIEILRKEVLDLRLKYGPKVTSIGPSIVPFNTQNVDLQSMSLLKPSEKVTTLITSGNLIEIKCIFDVGGYDNRLFIDSVDFDLSLRLKQRGYLQFRSKNAKLFHSIGQTITIKILFFKFKIITHNKIRKYYMSRNHIFILKKFFWKETFFCLKKILFFGLFMIQATVLEKNGFSNLKTILKGLFDGIINRYDNSLSDIIN